MGLITFIFFICALRMNIVFVLIIFSLMIAFLLLAGAHWALAEDFSGNATIGRRCIIVREANHRIARARLMGGS
jgi:succinate-acetate transporter protein